MRTLRDLYHSIPHAELTPIRPFPTLADICLLRYLPFSPCCPLLADSLSILTPWRQDTYESAPRCPDIKNNRLYSYVDHSRSIPFNSPRRAESNPHSRHTLRLLAYGLLILLYFGSPGKYCQIVSYLVLLFSRLALINIFLFEYLNDSNK